jgi:outer membrane protein assembly factor BamB
MSDHCGRTPLIAFALGILANTATANAQELAWELEGFGNPEAVLVSDDGSFLYVSNTNGGPAEKNGQGYISRVGLDGTMLDAEWATGLHAPKGMLEVGEILYVTDIDRLVALDSGNGAVVSEWRNDEASYLNGLTVDDSGRVYVSDTAESKVFRLVDDRLELWIDSEALDYPNGLRFEDGRILVAGWGRPNPDWSTEVPGHLKAVDIKTGAITSASDGKPIGNLDGIKTDGNGNWLVTDFMGGALYRIDPSGAAYLLLDLDAGSADFEFVQAERLAVFPMFLDGKVVAYRLE